MRSAMLEASQSELGKHLSSAGSRLGASDALHLQAKRHVLEHRAPGEEHVLLRHVPEVMQSLHRRQRFPVNEDVAGIDIVEPGNQIEQRRLATARWTNQCRKLTVGNSQRDIAERNNRVGASPVCLIDRLNFEHGARYR